MPNEMDSRAARRIVEALRAGIPSCEVSSVFTEGQANLLQRSGADLTRVAQGESAYLIARGQYGEGKSHLLSAIENMARAERFVVSNVVLSKETPFNRINKVYQAVAHSVRVPDLPRPGFEDLLLRIGPGTPRADEIAEFAEKHLHPKIWYVFKNYLSEGDGLKRAQLYDDLAGASMAMQDLRAIHRGNFHEAMRFPRRFLIQQDTQDYFRFLSFVFRSSGYAGWVILLDEVELLSKLGIGSRAQAYVNLAALLGLNGDLRPLSGVYFVLALASPFVEEALLSGGRHDLARVPEWLADPRRSRAGDVSAATAAMQAIAEQSIPLAPMTEQNIDTMLKRLEAFHGSAYGWDDTLNATAVEINALALGSNPIRTTIRAALEYLDLLYQYGEPPDIEVRRPDTGSLAEDTSFETDDRDNN